MDFILIHYALKGAIWLGHILIGLFFLRFWRITRDRLFAMFALSFWIFAFERTLLIIIQPEAQLRPYIHLVRLAAFLLIILAVIDKNRVRPATKTQSVPAEQSTTL